MTPYVVEIDSVGQVRAVGEAATPYKPNDAQIAHHLARFITDVRSLSIDPIVVRQNWLEAYEYTTDRGAATLATTAGTANDALLTSIGMCRCTRSGSGAVATGGGRGCTC